MLSVFNETWVLREEQSNLETASYSFAFRAQRIVLVFFSID